MAPRQVVIDLSGDTSSEVSDEEESVEQLEVIDLTGEFEDEEEKTDYYSDDDEDDDEDDDDDDSFCEENYDEDRHHHHQPPTPSPPVSKRARAKEHGVPLYAPPETSPAKRPRPVVKVKQQPVEVKQQPQEKKKKKAEKLAVNDADRQKAANDSKLLAKAAYARGDYEHAAKMFLTISRTLEAGGPLLKAEAATEVTNAAGAYLMLSEMGERYILAEQLCLRALLLDPGQLRAALRLSRARFHLNKLAAAQKDAHNAIRLARENPDAKCSRAVELDAEEILRSISTRLQQQQHQQQRQQRQQQYNQQQQQRQQQQQQHQQQQQQQRQRAQAPPAVSPAAGYVNNVSRSTPVDGLVERLAKSLFFVVLDLKPNASGDVEEEQVRRAYKKAALVLHPDKLRQRKGGQCDEQSLKDAAERFCLCRDAYETLVDPTKKRQYKWSYEIVGTHLRPPSSGKVVDFDARKQMHVVAQAHRPSKTTMLRLSPSDVIQHQQQHHQHHHQFHRRS